MTEFCALDAVEDDDFHGNSSDSRNLVASRGESTIVRFIELKRGRVEVVLLFSSAVDSPDDVANAT